MECEFYDMPLFRGCDRTLVDPILEKSPSRIANYRKGEFIAMQNSVCRSLLLLCEGSVRVQMTNEEGREFTLDTLAAPDVLASAFLFATENTFPVSVIANTECRLWIVSRESLLALIESDTAVLRNFLSILSDHSRFLTSRVQQFALQTLSSRLIGYLEKNPAVQNLQETAFILGVTRPSLSRTIAQLVRQGCDGVPIGPLIAEGQIIQQAAAPGVVQQCILDLLGDGQAFQAVLQRCIHQVIQRGEHAHQIGVRFGDGHILGILHQLAAEVGPHEGKLEEFLRAFFKQHVVI